MGKVTPFDEVTAAQKERFCFVVVPSWEWTLTEDLDTGRQFYDRDGRLFCSTPCVCPVCNQATMSVSAGLKDGIGKGLEVFCLACETFGEVVGQYVNTPLILAMTVTKVLICLVMWWLNLIKIV